MNAIFFSPFSFRMMLEDVDCIVLRFSENGLEDI